MKEKPKSLEEVDPKLLETYSKLGIPLTEQKKLAGVIEENAESEKSKVEELLLMRFLIVYRLEQPSRKS